MSFFQQTFDPYSIRARLLPALILCIPLGFAVGSWLPLDEPTWGLLSSSVVAVACSAILSEFVRDRGKMIEKELFSAWSHKPTTLMLSYAHTSLNHDTLHRYHDKLRSLLPALQLPNSQVEEAENMTSSIGAYESATDFLRERTRDKSRFPLVFAENVQYGFRRNLFGVRALASLFCIAAILSNDARLGLPLWFPDVEISWLSASYLAASILLLLYFLYKLTEGWVRVVGDEYARQLLSSLDQL